MLAVPLQNLSQRIRCAISDNVSNSRRLQPGQAAAQDEGVRDRPCKIEHRFVLMEWIAAADKAEGIHHALDKGGKEAGSKGTGAKPGAPCLSLVAVAVAAAAAATNQSTNPPYVLFPLL